MSNRLNNVSAMNNSTCKNTPNIATNVKIDETKQILSTLLPKVEKIGVDLECKIDNLNRTKINLFGLLCRKLEKLSEGSLKNDLYSLIFQIQTIDDCLQECMTSDDFFNLDSFIYETKQLLTQKSA